MAETENAASSGTLESQLSFQARASCVAITFPETQLERKVNRASFAHFPVELSFLLVFEVSASMA
jgi:hypothetical protein